VQAHHKEQPRVSPLRTLADVLPHVSPSRVLPALRRREEDWDEDLGFLDLENDPSMQDTVNEESAMPAAKGEQSKKPSVFIGELDKLLEFVKLFPPICPARDCGCRMAGHWVTSVHTTAILYLKCSEGHQCMWRSAQEGDERNVPRVTMKLYDAALSAGMGLTELSEFAEEVGHQTPGEKEFYAFQNGTAGRMGWIDAVIQVSEADLEANREMVKSRDGADGTVVYQDARFDSSRDGYHGTVPVLDMVSGKPLHIVTLTRIETGSSWKTEDACVRKATEEVMEKGVIVAECVHDDKASVDSILAELGIHSSKDLWHKCKKFCAQFKEDLGKAKRGSIASVEEARVSQDLDTLTAAALKKWLKDAGVTIRCNIHLGRPRNSFCPLEYTDNSCVNKHNTGS
jgi:hypothetical protein